MLKIPTLPSSEQEERRSNIFSHDDQESTNRGSTTTSIFRRFLTPSTASSTRMIPLSSSSSLNAPTVSSTRQAATATTDQPSSQGRRSSKFDGFKLNSPMRRKNTPLTDKTNIADYGSSPRNGAGSKRSRTSNSLPEEIRYGITDSLGWRRLLTDEIVDFDVGNEFVLVIPTDVRTDDDIDKQARRDFRIELISSIVESSPSLFNKSQNLTVRQRVVNQHLIDNHGITRNNSTYIELRCSVASYPNKHYYAENAFSLDEAMTHVRGDYGMNIRLFDYPGSSPLLKWKQLRSIQIFAPHYRGDHRPQVKLTEPVTSPLYAQEVDHQLHQVKDDPLQTTELRLVYEQKKSADLEKQIKKLQANATKDAMRNEQLTSSYIKSALTNEIESSRLTEFAHLFDKKYYDAWVDHYSNFQSNNRLLPEETSKSICDTIEKLFPFHYMSLKTVIFGKRAQEPARAKLPGNIKKMKDLPHRFLAMIRERNPHLLVHWAMVSSIAMYYKGVCMKYTRSFIFKPCTTMLKTAFTKLDKIYEATLPIRLRLLRQSHIGSHSSDNYQQYHAYKTQRCGAPGVYHNGMVYNFVMAKEFNKPRGTIVEHLPTRHRWKVVESNLVDYWCCRVVLERVFTDADDAEDATNATQPAPSSSMSPSTPPSPPSDPLVLRLPHIHWRIISMPGEAPPVDITYVHQDVPPSLRQRIPPNTNDTRYVLGAREWMDPDAEPLGDAPRVTPRKFVELLHDCERIKELLSFDPTFDTTMTPRYECLSVFRSKMEQLMKVEPSMYDSARTFRVDNLRYWNKSYDAVDKYLLYPITPHDEMKKDEAMLAMVQICIDLGLIEENDSNEYSICEDAHRRTIFQYGDVLTIQKWQQLAHVILSKMTHIGKEDFVEMMMKVYNNFIKSHDYLHENIHRLQFIFTIYYGGFIQACQVVLGTKRIRQDPTKGKWRDSEILTMKIYWALRRVRLEEFLRRFMARDDTKQLLDMNDKDPCDIVWKLEKEYQSFCDSLETCACEKSRAAALFMKYTQDWLLCMEGVSLGDWATLEVQGHDWLARWFCVKKPQYREECQRRIEMMYALPAWLLEYIRMNRFIRMSNGARFISLDDFCEKHNLAQKLSTKSSNFEKVCNRSRHLHAAQRCAKELFGDKVKKGRAKMSVVDDVKALYAFFRKVDIFTTPDVPFKIREMTFWEHVIPANFDQTVEREKHTAKNTIALTEAKKGVIKTFFDSIFVYESDDDSESDDNIEEEEGNNNDDDVSVSSVVSHNSVGSVGTVMSSLSIMSDISVAAESSQLANVNFGTLEVQEAALKRLGNVSRCKMNMLLIKDLTIEGIKRIMDANIIEQRKNKLNEEKRVVQMLYDCVARYKDKMTRQLSFMQSREDSIPEQIGRELEDWELALIEELEVSD